MPSRKASVKRTRHGTRKWVLTALQSAGASGELRGSQVRAKVAALSGATIPDHSVYQALRTLVRGKVVRATRIGREFSYQLVSGKQAAPAASTVAPKARSRRPPAKPDGETRRELHKLAMGDIVILRIGDSFVETATNLNGRLVVERHSR
ncbi:MAG: hypothetical protein ACREBZ_02550 [Thermoplasmata archaeon]